MRTGYSKGANLYLTKPFEPERLLKNIRVHFEEMKSLRKKRYTMEQIADLESGKLSAEDSAPKFELPDTISAESRDRIVRSTRKIVRPESDQLHTPSSDEMPTRKPVNRPRILIIDDEEDILMIMEHALESHAEIVRASDGIEAVQHLVKYQPDLLVIDIMLPKMNGFQLCQSLRSNRAFETIPILMCSAKAQKKDIDMALRSGATDFLPKPFEPDDLLKKVLEMEKSPNFRIRPNKKVTWEEIQKENEPAAEEEDVFGAQEAEHREKLEQMARDAEKEALEAHDRVGDDNKKAEKKKRRLFGFGR